MRYGMSILALLGLAPAIVTAQTDFNAPFPPHHVIDNVYFVGTARLGSYLITTPAGHILVNSDFETTVPLLRENVESLGFRFSDIKLLLGSHAHADHMEGDALVKQLTGADVVAMAEDVPALQAMRPGGKRHPIDRIVHDGDRVSLGGTTLTAYRTPGHTKGCTSWSFEVVEDGRTYAALIVCSFGVNDDYVLVRNPDYPSIADDYVATYSKARTLPVDVFLAAHGSFYDLDEKYRALQKRKPGDPNPFVDHAGYLAYVDRMQQRFEAMLNSQREAAASP